MFATQLPLAALLESLAWDWEAVGWNRRLILKKGHFTLIVKGDVEPHVSV